MEESPSSSRSILEESRRHSFSRSVIRPEIFSLSPYRSLIRFPRTSFSSFCVFKRSLSAFRSSPVSSSLACCSRILSFFSRMPSPASSMAASTWASSASRRSLSSVRRCRFCSSKPACCRAFSRRIFQSAASFLTASSLAWREKSSSSREVESTPRAFSASRDFSSSAWREACLPASSSSCRVRRSFSLFISSLEPDISFAFSLSAIMFIRTVFCSMRFFCSSRTARSACTRRAFLSCLI